MDRSATRWGVATSPGLVRTNNEDSVFAEFPVFVVADGMGGQAAGEVASALVSRQFRELAGAGQLTVDSVSEAIEQANHAVIDAARDAEDLAGMGTTLVGLVLVYDDGSPLWLAFNVGDSRLYRFFDGTLVQVSTDHSEVQLLVDAGAISPTQARSHPHRNVITRAIGGSSPAEPDFWLLPPVPGERFLICSDGLTGEVDDATVASVLAAEDDPKIAATRLVEKAMESGGRDNISVVVVEVLPEPCPPAGAEPADQGEPPGPADAAAPPPPADPAVP